MMMLTEDYGTVLPRSGKSLVISKGFMTDGTSIPHEAWSLIRATPFDPDLLAPSVAHDALYEAELVPRSDADGEFEDMLTENSRRGRDLHFLFFIAVRAGGRVVWNRHTPESIAEARKFCSIRI